MPTSSLLRPKPVPLHGTDVSPAVWLGVNSDVGVLLGGGINLTTYRAGHQPYYRWLQIKGGYATTPGDYAVEIHGKFNRWRSREAITLDAGLSQIAVLHFFGYGNDTPFDQPKSYYKARQTQLYLYPAWNFLPGRDTRFTIGPVFKRVVTDTTGDNLLNATRPYGVPEFAQLGVQASAIFDSRDAPAFTRHGAWISMGGSFYPVVFGAGSPFWRDDGARGRIPDAPRDAMRSRSPSAARRASGSATCRCTRRPTPAAPRTLRGYESNRYAGDAAVYFNNEVRLQAGTLPFIMPWHFGMVGIVDVGRVFQSGGDDHIWHSALGGGVWVAMPDRSLGGVVTVVHSAQGTSIWLGTDFIF